MKCIHVVSLLLFCCCLLTTTANALGSRAPAAPPLSLFDAKVRKTFDQADMKGRTTLDECYELIRNKIPINSVSRAAFNQTIGVYYNNKGGGGGGGNRNIVLSSWAFTQVVATLRMRSIIQLGLRSVSTVGVSAFLVRIVSYHLWMNLDLALGSIVDFIPFLDFAVIDSELTLQVILTMIFFYNIVSLLMGGIKTFLWLNEDKVKHNADGGGGSVTVDPPVYYSTPPPPPPAASARGATSIGSSSSSGKMVLGAGAAAAAGLWARMDSEMISKSISNSLDLATMTKKKKAFQKKKKKKAPPKKIKKKKAPTPAQKKRGVITIVPQKLMATSPPLPPKKKKVPPPPPPKKVAVVKKKAVKKQQKPTTNTNNKVLEGNELTAGAKARGAVAAGVVMTMGSL